MENTLENRQCGMLVFREKSQKKKSFESIT